MGANNIFCWSGAYDNCELVTHFHSFKVSNSVLPEREIREMCRNRQKYFYQCRFNILKWLRIYDRSKIGVVYSSNAFQGCWSRLHEFSFVYFDLVVFWSLSLRLHWSQLDSSYFLSWHRLRLCKLWIRALVDMIEPYFGCLYFVLKAV